MGFARMVARPGILAFVVLQPKSRVAPRRSEKDCRERCRLGEVVRLFRWQLAEHHPDAPRRITVVILVMRLMLFFPKG